MMYSWIHGDSLSPAQIASTFGIPRDEIASFQQRIRIYSKGAVIIEEGARDRVIYLLRSGEVDVYRKDQTGKGVKLNSIPAINVFGEMAMINEAPRSASIYAVSEDVLVYAFDLSSLSQLFDNPRWSSLLISRFSRDIAHNHEQLAEAARTIAELKGQVARAELETEAVELQFRHFSEETAAMFNSLFLLFEVVQTTAVVGSRGWVYLDAWNKVARTLSKELLASEASRPKTDDTLEPLLAALERIPWPGKSAIYATLVEQVRARAAGK